MFHRLSRVAAFPIVLLASLCAAPMGSAPAAAGADAADSAQNEQALGIFRELIGIDTTNSLGSATTAAEAMARRFREAGFPSADIVIAGPNELMQNLVVRLRGNGARRPVLLIGHLDVVAAHREDWSTDPFTLVEKDGYFYGRGSSDMKDGDAIMVATLLRLKREGYHGTRDIILALTAQEEGGCCNGPQWLIDNRRDLIDAEFVINHDGSSVQSENGVAKVFRLGATEKVYADFQLTAVNRGGHSSQPRDDNAIYELAGALLKIAAHRFPFELNPVSRTYFERSAATAGGEAGADMRAVAATPPDPAALERLARDPVYNSMMRTTCVATRLDGGHANNALPQRAQANVNCRILTGHSPEEVRRELIAAIGDPGIVVRYVSDNGDVSDTAPERRGFPPPPLMPQVLDPLERIVAATWPGIPVIPVMIGGASDAVHTSAAGMPTYGISGVAIDRDDYRAHGRDERIRVESFYAGDIFFYRYLKALTAP